MTANAFAYTAAVLAIAALATGCPATEEAIGVKETPGEAITTELGGPVAPLATAVVEGYVGVIVPRDVAEVPAPVTTNVLEWLVVMGQQVEKDTPLVRLEKRPIAERLAIAKNELAASRARIGNADAQRRAALKSLNREKSLAAADVSAKAQVEAAAADYEKSSASLSQAVAESNQNKEKVEQLERLLKDTTLLSPIQGRVAVQYIQAGTRVDEGKPVVKVISSDRLFVRFAIADSARPQPGDALDIVVEQTNVHIKGVIKTVAPEIDATAQMTLAEAELESPPADLEAGLVCNVVVLPKAATGSAATKKP